jgi:hypothetical protein
MTILSRYRRFIEKCLLNNVERQNHLTFERDRWFPLLIEQFSRSGRQANDIFLIINDSFVQR